MNQTSKTRDAWYPQTQQDRDAILHELKEVLSSHHFSNSKRYPALLQYIVENTLKGKSELLKERNLGIDVFDRSPTYDSSADTVVRYTAGEVRKRLSLYYHERGGASRIRISLPAGSYIPEFQLANEEPEETGDKPGLSGASMTDGPSFAKTSNGRLNVGSELTSTSVLRNTRATAEIGPVVTRSRATAITRRVLWLALAALILITATAVLRARYRAKQPQTAIDEFWGPVLREQHLVPIFTGSVVFAQNKYSGTLTADKNIEYPFVSMQGASALVLVSNMLQASGAATELRSAASTPLTELREHSFILLGAYNNQWTLRLLEPLRFHFTAEPNESIIDQMQPPKSWARDHSLPYSSADDYAVVARYRDPTTDSWVVVLAGLGRNATEAAAQFASSPHYMQLLRDQAGKGFSDRNIEAILKVSVIDGKTGAPSIQAVHVW